MLQGNYKSPGDYGVDTEFVWTNYYVTYTLPHLREASRSAVEDGM